MIDHPQRTTSFNADNDVREVPNYTVTEAAHCLQIPRTTLRQWIAGRYYPTEQGLRFFEPLIRPVSQNPPLLSFMNLVEAHILSAIRREHQIRLMKIREALRFIYEHFPSKHPLADQRFETDGITLFVQKYDQLIDIGRAGQLAMRSMLEAYLRRVERDEEGLAARLYPFTSMPHVETQKLIVIDPTIAFGRPALVGRGIPTTVIAQRYKAGESIKSLMQDYDCDQIEIEEAIRCELHLEAA